MTRESTVRVVRARRQSERSRSQYRHGFALRVTGGTGCVLCGPLTSGSDKDEESERRKRVRRERAASAAAEKATRAPDARPIGTRLGTAGASREEGVS